MSFPDRLCSKMLITCQVCSGDGRVCAKPDWWKRVLIQVKVIFQLSCRTLIFCEVVAGDDVALGTECYLK